MRIKFEFRKYNSKLATIVSVLKSGIAGFALWVSVFYLPVIICAIIGVDCTILAIVMGIVAVITFILFCVFVKADKVDEYMSRKKRKNDVPEPPPVRPQYQSDEERRRALLMRSYVGTQIAAEKKQDDTEGDQK